MSDEEVNHGVLHGWRDTDYIGGTLPHEVRNPSGDWTPYAPPGEWQKNNYFDTFGCVSFSALNSIEMQYKLFTGTERNFSDRFTVIMSGTIPGQGNWVFKVGDSLRKDGFVDEAEFPAPPEYNQATYFAPPSIEVINKAKLILNDWEVKYEYLDSPEPSMERMLYELKHCPLWITTRTHAMVGTWVVSEQGLRKLFDSYEPFFKDRTEPFFSVWKLVLNPKINTITEKEVYRLQLLEGYKDPVGVAYWTGKPLSSYLQSRLEDQKKDIDKELTPQ